MRCPSKLLRIWGEGTRVAKTYIDMINPLDRLE